ncbi:hypothetical protein H0H87_004002 [Tephrocybe sp. NHM501043]|nr:hypothetical protein H0H87_004002 [Tephrocybe sp. NHM501043]
MAVEDTEPAKILSCIKLPGFGLPVDYLPPSCNMLVRPSRSRSQWTRSIFPNALDGHGDQPALVMPLTTLREFTMLHFMDEITDKPNWNQKVFDDAIVAKWRTEALSGERDVTKKMLDWCIAELRYKAKLFEDVPAVSVYNGDVVKSDHLIPDTLREALKAAAASLESVPASEKDWHPGSDCTVLDLVHPSLFPLIYGRSRILPTSKLGRHDCIERSGEGEIVASPDHVFESWSPHFQWLPCDVDISGGKGNVRIASYINNLHPEGKQDLYSILENIIDLTIPLWNMSLTAALNIQKENYLVPYRYTFLPSASCLRIPCINMRPIHRTPQPAWSFSNDGDEYDELLRKWKDEGNQIIISPEPESFLPPGIDRSLRHRLIINEFLTDHHLGSIAPSEPVSPESVDLWKDYASSGLQIIVKLANIQLSPEKPKYQGGSWHVEGKLNERICATAIYYYDSENVTASSLALRQQVETDGHEIGRTISYEQFDYDWITAIFGCKQNGPGVQNIGTVNTPEGRLLAWPNILQHRVQPFQLVDPTKPGHRKILALFLVDPHIRVISTANVPCQQKEWWIGAIRSRPSRLSGLPVEVQNIIFNFVEDNRLSMDEAKAVRDKLIEERKEFVAKQSQECEDLVFSLCEH